MTERVLIIGATSRVAQDIVLLHAARGDELFLVARNGEKLAALFGSLPTLRGSAVVDFSANFDPEALLTNAKQTLGDIERVIIVYGELGDQELTEKSISAARQLISINFTSVVELIIPIANYFEERGTGRLGVVGSVAGDRGRPRNYTYGAAKGALALYLQGVRSRLFARGVSVTTIRLGPVDTPMTTHHEKNLLFSQPARAAKLIVRAMDRKAGDVYVPGYWRLIMAIVRNTPERLFQKLSFLSGR